mmetsp:Transcript_37101/g.77093  ORF Transcript_37101/g.77093 Transcript_37101/m.77093 type:complete len:287 (-) Transcript_37101:294-1154(-)
MKHPDCRPLTTLGTLLLTGAEAGFRGASSLLSKDDRDMTRVDEDRCMRPLRDGVGRAKLDTAILGWVRVALAAKAMAVMALGRGLKLLLLYKSSCDNDLRMADRRSGRRFLARRLVFLAAARSSVLSSPEDCESSMCGKLSPDLVRSGRRGASLSRSRRLPLDSVEDALVVRPGGCCGSTDTPADFENLDLANFVVAVVSAVSSASTEVCSNPRRYDLGACVFFMGPLSSSSLSSDDKETVGNCFCGLGFCCCCFSFCCCHFCSNNLAFCRVGDMGESGDGGPTTN